MRKILLIEDNTDLSSDIKAYIERFDYVVSVAGSLGEGQALLKEGFDLALLDMNLPDGDGLILLKAFQEAGIKTIITTVKNDENFIVACLDQGADDYMVKPFSLALLRARIDLALRDLVTISDDQVRYKDFLLDMGNWAIFYQGEKLDLGPKEFDLLALMLQHPHRIFTRDFLLGRFWDDVGAYVNDNTLTVTVKRIREKIGKDCISTIRGIGYRLD